MNAHVRPVSTPSAIIGAGFLCLDCEHPKWMRVHGDPWTAYERHHADQHARRPRRGMFGRRRIECTCPDIDVSRPGGPHETVPGHDPNCAVHGG